MVALGQPLRGWFALVNVKLLACSDEVPVEDVVSQIDALARCDFLYQLEESCVVWSRLKTELFAVLNVV